MVHNTYIHVTHTPKMEEFEKGICDLEATVNLLSDAVFFFIYFWRIMGFSSTF